jgi:uncharacterized protein YxjI
MDKLADVSGLVISQKKEWGEVLTGFETSNRYVVLTPEGRELYFAAEEGTSFLSRNFLKSLRPFTVRVVDAEGATALSIRRSFRLYFHKAEVLDADGALVGTIQKRFSVVRRIYRVSDAGGQEAFELFGPVLHPWTFQVRVDGREIGKITKKWSGLLTEGYTDADNFGAAFPADLDVRAKALMLGAVFLIDFVHFEQR